MENFKETLFREASKNNINLSEDMLNKLEKYKNLILEWNEKINLTAITDEYEIIMKHFIDSLEIVKYIKENEKIIDVGTGAGLPGIIIAIYFKGKVKITLLDALEKRLKFIEEVIKELKLENIEIVHGRAEEIAQKLEYREKYDISTARAVSALNVLIELNSPFLKIGGKCLLLKGEKASEEVEVSKKAFEILNCKLNKCHKYLYNIDDETYSRAILEIEKIGKTPNKYPRNFGKIKKNPL